MFDRNGKRIYKGDVVTSPVMDGTVISTNRIAVLVKIKNDDTGFETWANPNDCEIVSETTSPNHEDDIFMLNRLASLATARMVNANGKHHVKLVRYDYCVMTECVV